MDLLTLSSTNPQYRKLRLSINEIAAGYDLLKTPYYCIGTDDNYVKLLERFLILQDTEKPIDAAL